MMTIKQGAIFISDSHANKNRVGFLKLLHYLNSSGSLPEQIFFVGDMFDFLTFSKYTREFYKEYIDLINALSLKVEIFYFEGNHDFNLMDIFPNVKVFQIQKQPVVFLDCFNNRISIAHGDIFLKPITMVFLRILRNKKFIMLMDWIDGIFDFKISKLILKRQNIKNLYNKIPNFKDCIQKKIKKYKTNFIIEGHYHQDVVLEFDNIRYINLNSYAVDDKLYRVKCENTQFLLQQCYFKF